MFKYMDSINKKFGVEKMMRKTIIKVCAAAIVMTFFLPGFLSESGSAKVVLSEGDMSANGVAVDSQDNVIVTGQVYDNDKGKWIIRTEKYAGSDGHLIWSKDFDKYNYNIGKDVAVDSNDNIIVAGSVNETVTDGFNYCLIKYSKDGDQLWYKTFNRKFYDTPWRVVVDSSNNIFVTGMSLKIDLSAGVSGDYWTVKCASNGNKLKEKVFDESNADLAFGIAIDSSNDVIVTGSSNHNSHLAYCTLKYDSNLNDVWGPTYYGSGSENNSGSGVAVDSNDNIIVTGGSDNGGNKDYLTVKYDSSGSKLRENTYDFGGTDDAMGVAVDSSDNIIVTGTSTSSAGEHFCTVKYNSNLGFLWSKKESSFVGGAKDVAVDSDNNIIVTGYNASGGSHYYTIKYSPTKQIIWAGGGGSGPAEAPSADFSYTPASPTRADFVHFYDKSTGDVTSWSWNFGDGVTSTDSNPSHKYSGTGTFTVTLTVSGPAGDDTKTKQITVSNAEPVASFSYSPPNPVAGQTVAFDASASYDPDGSISSYSWNFGDGNTSTEQNPSHLYTSNGTYTVLLSVTDNDGTSSSAQKIVTVNAQGGNTPPVPSFDYSPSSPAPGDEITFDASASTDADGIIELYRWDWNSDGNYDDEYTSPDAVHTWYESGEYNVTLQVKDNNGSANTYTLAIYVGESGNAELKISSGTSDVSMEAGKEKSITFEIKCFNGTVSGVTVSVLDDAGTNITITPSSEATLKAGDTKVYSMKIKMPQNFSGNGKIKIQAEGDGSVKSNIYEISITAKSGDSTPGFASILAIGAILIVILFMKKMK